MLRDAEVLDFAFLLEFQEGAIRGVIAFVEGVRAMPAVVCAEDIVIFQTVFLQRARHLVIGLIEVVRILVGRGVVYGNVSIVGLAIKLLDLLRYRSPVTPVSRLMNK